MHPRRFKPRGEVFRTVLPRRAAVRGLLLGAAAVPLGGKLAERAAAQEASPAAGTTHPIVGSWIFTGTAGPAEAINAFSADGLAHITGRAGQGHGAGVGHGAWQATSDSTAAATYVIGSSLDDGTPITITVRGTIEVDPGGDRLVAKGLFQVKTIDGTVIFVQPSEATGERIKVEPPEATEMPAGGGFPAGTPEASPAA